MFFLGLSLANGCHHRKEHGWEIIEIINVIVDDVGPQSRSMGFNGDFYG